MNIELAGIVLLNTASSDIRLVRQNKSRCDLAHRNSVSFIMISNRADDRSDVHCRKLQTVQNLKCHHGPGLRMVHAIDDVADIVQPGRGKSQINDMRIRLQCRQDISGPLRHNTHMCQAVLRIMQRLHRFILLININIHVSVIPDHFKQGKGLL